MERAREFFNALGWRAGQTHKYFKEYMPTIAVATFLCYGKT